jgi:hypothetical protein
LTDGPRAAEALSVSGGNAPDNQTVKSATHTTLPRSKEIPGSMNAFTTDGTFTDKSTGIKYRGETLGDLVEMYGAAPSDMRRDL